MDSPTFQIMKKPPLHLIKPKFKTAFKSKIITKLFNAKAQQISLRTKQKKNHYIHHGKNLSVQGTLAFNISDENILKTPSTINDNQPLSLDLLDQSLNNYYELEVNRITLNNTSITPIPSLPENKYNKKTVRSCTPKLVTGNKKKREKFPVILNQEVKDKNRRNKSVSPVLKEIQKNSTIRYFSRRERKLKYPVTKKFVYYHI